MAGNGDINNPLAFTSGASSLTTGAHGAPPAQGDVLGDGGDPDIFLGSFTLQIVAPTLGVAAVPAVTGNGDVGDVFGAPDLAGEAQVAGLIAFSTGTPTLVPTGTTTPAGNGDLGDTGGPTTLQGEPNDSNAGFGTLTSFNSGSPSLGLGSLVQNTAYGDIDDVQGSDSGPIFQAVWYTVAPALVTQQTTTPVGQGDIPNPYSWQDSIFYLTSQPYPLLVGERFTSGGGINIPPQFPTIEHFKSSVLITGGTLTTSLFTYSNWPAEHFKDSALITGGTLVLGLIAYSNWPAEHLQGSALITGGTLVLGLVTYSNWPIEHVQSSGAITGGTLI